MGIKLPHELKTVCNRAPNFSILWWEINTDVTDSDDNKINEANIGIIIIIIMNLLRFYSAFLGTQSASHSKGDISSSTTSVQHPHGWCDGSHSAPERPPHTRLLVERRQSDEANRCMGMIRRPWGSEANGRIWPGCQGYTPTLFRRTSWDF